MEPIKCFTVHSICYESFTNNLLYDNIEARYFDKELADTHAAALPTYCGYYNESVRNCVEEETIVVFDTLQQDLIDKANVPYDDGGYAESMNQAMNDQAEFEYNELMRQAEEMEEPEQPDPTDTYNPEC